MIADEVIEAARARMDLSDFGDLAILQGPAMLLGVHAGKAGYMERHRIPAKGQA